MVRDKNRIDRICDLLRVEWHKHPDLRLGQLVDNLAQRTGHLVFYMEDCAIELVLISEVTKKRYKAVFEFAVKEIQKELQCPAEEAREVARRTHPDLYRAYYRHVDSIDDGKE